MKYIEIDIHKQCFVATVMHDNGKVIGREMVSTDREGSIVNL